MKTISVTTHDELEALDSALTWEGLAVDEKNFQAVKDWMAEHGAKLKTDTIYVTKGAAMNAAEGLTGDNAYPDDLNIVSIMLENIENWQALTIPRFEVGGRWMDDILDNNRRRQGY